MEALTAEAEARTAAAESSHPAAPAQAAVEAPREVPAVV